MAQEVICLRHSGMLAVPTEHDVPVVAVAEQLTDVCEGDKGVGLDRLFSSSCQAVHIL